MSLLDWIFGPLAGFECRWALTRRWVLWFRIATCLLYCAVLLPVVWYWWIAAQMQRGYLPGFLLRGSLITLQLLNIIIVLLLGPALLAGTLAGEKDRGDLGLLLTTRASAREIVMSRWSSRLSQVGVILLAGFPVLILNAVWCDLGLRGLACLLAVLVAIAFGVGGISVAASASSRRGRDALLVVYLLWIVLILGAYFRQGAWPALALCLTALDPFQGVSALARAELTLPTICQIVLWLGLGCAGLAWASWRLGQPAGSADESRVKSIVRSAKIPSADERPMIWKELYIERATVLGRMGRWIGSLIIVVVLGGSLTLGGMYCWYTWVNFNSTNADWAQLMLRDWTSYTGILLSCLIQIAVGLRAAVGIASERERLTWDGLLLSPLEGDEIVWAKLWGALYAMRTFAAAVAISWSLALILGAMDWSDYVALIASTVVIGFFMAAAGVRTSLSTTTATRGMTLTVFLWLAAVVAFSLAALIITLILVLVGIIIWLVWAGANPGAFRRGPWLPFGFTWHVMQLSLFAAVGYALAIWTHRRFDRIVGRSSVAPYEAQPVQDKPSELPGSGLTRAAVVSSPLTENL